MDWLEFLPVIHLAWASLFRRSANFEAQPWALTVWPKRERAASRGGSWSGPTCHSGARHSSSTGSSRTTGVSSPSTWSMAR